MPLRTSRESRQGLPRPSSLRGGSGIRGSNTSHCPSVRSMLCFHSCQKDVRQGHYSLASTFMRWLLDKAMSESDNTVFVQLALDLGLQNVTDTAAAMGVTTPVDSYPSTAIGDLGTGVSALEMASA